MKCYIDNQQLYIATLEESFSRDVQVYKPDEDALPDEYNAEDVDSFDRFDILVNMQDENDYWWVDCDRPIYLGVVSGESEDEALREISEATGFFKEQINLLPIEELIKQYSS